MATASVIQFMKTTAANEDIRLKLEELLGVGDGDISTVSTLDSEESAALKGKGPLVTEFAAQQGFTFSVDELSTVIEAFEGYQSGRLSEQDFKAAFGADVPKNLPPLKRMVKFLSKTYLGYA